MFNYQKSDVYAAPSFWAQISTGLLLLIALIVVFSNFDNLQRQGPYGTLVLILLFAIVIGIHGLSHLGLEAVYGYNPINCK